MSYLKKPEHIYVSEQNQFEEELKSIGQQTSKHDNGHIASIAAMIEKAKSQPPIIYVYPGVSENSFGFVFGPPKSGKTTFVEALFLHIAAGRSKFMNYELPLTNQKCLFISCEEGAKQQRFERNALQLEAFSPDEINHINGTNNYMVSTEQMPMHVYSDKDWNVLEKAIADSKAKLVAIDSLNRLTSDSNGDEEVAKGVTKKLESIAKKYGITLFVINHTTKSSCLGIQTVSSMSGSRIYGH